MKSYQILLSIIIVFFCICGAPVFAENITNCDIVHNNIYGPTFYNISTTGTFDETNMESDTTNIEGRYIYATVLSSEATAGGGRVDYTVGTIQGATVIGGSGNPVLPGWYWEYGDTTTERTYDKYHIYATAGTYITNLTLSNAKDTTGITLSKSITLSAPVITSIDPTPLIGSVTTLITLNATVTGATFYQWQKSLDNSSWSNIAGATSIESTWTPGVVDVYYVRLVAANTDFVVFSSIKTITIYAPPTITVTISPTTGPISNTLTLSGTITNPSPAALTYQWQYSPDSMTWMNIPGATTEDFILIITFPSSGTQYIRMQATGTGGVGTSNVVTYEAFTAPVFTSVTIDPAIGEIPLTVSLSATATSATSFKWQKLVGVVWTDIASTQTTTYSVTTAAVHQFRAIATGPGGTTTSSVVSVNAGGKPIISITEPLYNSIHASNISMTLSASIVGADSFNWNFGDDTAVGDTTANPTTVIYSAFGSKTIVLTATNIYGTVTDTVVISIGSASSRPFATGTIAPVSTQTLDNLTDEFHVSAGEFPDPVNIFFAISAPYEDIIGAFFMLFVFGVIFIMLWLITKNVTVPCIIGIIFGAFILLYLPDGYYGPAIAIMAISITGGVIRVFMPPK